VVIGLIGLVSDGLFKRMNHALFPWAVLEVGVLSIRAVAKEFPGHPWGARPCRRWSP
jgi:hypothetical protein